MDKRLSLGINASVIIILIIFCALLSLPLRLLFNTNYEGKDSSKENNSESSLEKETKKETVLPLKVKDFRKMKLCPFGYESLIKSTFLTNYDQNCTRQQLVKEVPKLPLEAEKKETKEEAEEKEETEETIKEKEEKPVFVEKEEIGREIVSAPIAPKKEEPKAPVKIINKSIPVAVHILGIMLVVSVIAALVEVLLIRFSRDKDESTSSGSVNSRRGSIINFMAPKKFMPTREMLKSQRSLDLQAMHNRSTSILGVYHCRGEEGICPVGHVPRKYTYYIF
ncbi:uncharacterized protein LOC117175727 isoform X2 [Belonocnema kinseyi]|uniref:uncharacterized protein LOC117175727 isoform X2 n=1 Tax=Belonocnema kinseyi TaxID=2817044 RepID=UPI00143DD6B9|nr:uncharacterized protein LOC117175727 isoform X2 [Belonocnema kinseyi]